MNDYTIEVATAFDTHDEFYDAVAIVRWQGTENSEFCQQLVTRKWTTPLQRSRDLRRAISYALTEAALAFERGDIDP